MNQLDLYATSSNASKVQVCFTSEMFGRATESGGEVLYFRELKYFKCHSP